MIADEHFDFPYCSPLPEGHSHTLNYNGRMYKKAQVNGRWQWVIDEEKEKARKQFETHRSELVMAMLTRIVTDEELSEVLQWGSDILRVNAWHSPKDDYLNREFLHMLNVQVAVRKLLAKS